MALTAKHLAVIQEFVKSGKQGDAWRAVYGDVRHPGKSAMMFFKKPEVKKMVTALVKAKEEAMIVATKAAYEKMYAEEICTDLELDLFHSKVVRGKAEMEEVFAVTEKRLVNYQEDGKTKFAVETQTVFKRIKRAPTIKEQQVSARELYLRRGSYPKNLPAASDSQDDQKQAALANAGTGNETVERVVRLSTGEKLPI